MGSRTRRIRRRDPLLPGMAGSLPGRMSGSRDVSSIGPEDETEDGEARQADCTGSRVDICGRRLESAGPGLSPSPWSPHEVGCLALHFRAVCPVTGLPLWIGLFGAGLLDSDPASTGEGGGGVYPLVSATIYATRLYGRGYR